ncbi:MAG TPA: amino acid adenylation domain-containing protein [Gemmatimonadaceae bacterium]|nr:amino acid adenylation domain-containing protein [Gemmatimonadaceae bacterium]
MSRRLPSLLAASAARYPDRIAIEEGDGGAQVQYRDLLRLAARTRALLVAQGVRPGDRVGLFLPKTIDAVGILFGVMQAGAAYVPIDPNSPAGRAAYILHDAGVAAAFVDRRVGDALAAELASLGSTLQPLLLDAPGGGDALARVLDAHGVASDPAPGAPEDDAPHSADTLAYILYTSGSTGRPKGVMISHRAALAFVDWCAWLLSPTEQDCFSSHAPLHFDLSVLDLYVSLGHGARLVLIGEELGKEPLALGRLIAERRISIWYSTPSILSLLEQYGQLEKLDLTTLRAVLFAGEVFPIPRLRAVKARLPQPRFCNLYGPTETNVCTWYELPNGPVPAERSEPYPIGHTCAHYRARVVDEEGRDVARGEKGELVMAGPGVMDGYWNLPDRDATAFLVDAQGERWYRTGDLVVESPDEGFIFHGRRDRMVKRRGYRIELGEIEAALAAHAAVREAAAVAVPDEAAGVRIVAILACDAGTRPSIIELKRYCVERLPRYMIPDAFRFVEALPRTSTDKIDLQALRALA